MIKIIPMTENEVDGVTEIENECFSKPWSREGIAEELENDNSHFLCAVDGEVAGYIGVQEICGEAYITNIGVLKEYRRKGIARMLLKAACSGAKSRNCEFITLEVRESNIPAISLYVSEGFEKAGMRKNFYSSPTENALIYTKILPHG